MNYPEDKYSEDNYSKVLPKTGEKEVVLSDLDIVNHVNNVKYLEWCLDYVEPELILNSKIESFEMNFLRELSLKDLVGINKCNSSDKIQYTITKEERTCFVLEINLK
jgi:acyl-ACP thioesterase